MQLLLCMHCVIFGVVEYQLTSKVGFDMQTGTCTQTLQIGGLTSCGMPYGRARTCSSTSEWKTCGLVGKWS